MSIGEDYLIVSLGAVSMFLNIDAMKEYRLAERKLYLLKQYAKLDFEQFN